MDIQLGQNVQGGRNSSVIHISQIAGNHEDKEMGHGINSLMY